MATGILRTVHGEILDEIARGGMGVVYMAREPRSNRVVALKCVLAYQGDSDHVVARFRREAETAARLEHPNIVPIYQVGETADGFPYFTMKYAAAGSLLQARTPLPPHPRQSAALMVKVVRAVHYAHEQGVLHRDLKPGNILLDSHGEPLVSDFGLARCEAVSSYLTRSLASFGTPGYIAPEQADGPAANLTPAADVYSLGAILFELLTGRLPLHWGQCLRRHEAIGGTAGAETAQPESQSRSRSRNHLRPLPGAGTGGPLSKRGGAGRRPAKLAGRSADRRVSAVPFTAGTALDSPQSHPGGFAGGFGFPGDSLAALANPRPENSSGDARKCPGYAFGRGLAFPGPGHGGSGPGGDRIRGRFAEGELRKPGPCQGRHECHAGLEQVGKYPEGCPGGQGSSRRDRHGPKRRGNKTNRRSLVGDPASGRTLFTAAFEQKNSPARSSRQNADWVHEVYKILSADGWPATPPDPGVHNEKANEAMTSGRAWMESYTVSGLDQAIARFREAIAAEPDSSLAHSYLAIAATSRTHFVADWSYLELGKSEARKGLALDSNSVVGHRALAGVYYQEGKFHEALEELMQTIEIGGADEKNLSFLGMILDLLGRPDRALDWYQIASKMHKRPGEIELRMGDIWTELADDEQAFRAYDRATELQPGSVQGAVGKARLHALRGEFDPAREICINQLRNNELGEMVQVAAQIEFFARNYAAAEELYSKLAKGDEQGGGSFYAAVSYQSALGRIKQARGSNEIAMRLLQEALATERATLNRQPANPEAAYRLAAVEASLNLPEAALQHLHQAIALGWLDYRSLQKDPRFDSLRANPELNTLIDGLSAKVAELRSKTSKGIE